MRYSAWLLVLVGLVATAAPASAQMGGDSYSMRRAYGNDVYIWEALTRQKHIDPSGAARLPSTPGQLQKAPQLPAAPQPTPLTSGTNNTLEYFGGGAAARRTLAQLPQRPRFIPQGGTPVGAASYNKPFDGQQQDPTISPYLNLFREDLEESLPNYYTFVRPYQQQIETNRQQQQRLQGLQQKVQRASYQTPAGASGSLPPTGTRARFGDTGQFYSGWRR
ncbi:MAG: hypothetical protein KDA37_10915 [Planctomycetales bacterium]|nr:hypothetical protein [Planctomycetales bacterium]